MFHGNIDQFGKSLPGIQLCLRSDLRKQTRKRKDKKSIQRCQIDRLAKGYKRAIDEIRGPIAKNGFSGQNPARWPENGPPSGHMALFLAPGGLGSIFSEYRQVGYPERRNDMP